MGTLSTTPGAVSSRNPPSTRGGPTPGPTRTGRSCTRVAGRSSVPSPWTPSGRRSMTSGRRGPPKGFPSGLGRGQARRLEMPRLPRVRRLRRPRLLRRRRSLRKRRRRRKRRSKLILLEVKQLLSPKNIPDWFLFFLESQRFAVLKTKWLCIFYVKLYWISMDFYGFLCKTILDFFLSPVTNKINTLGMEANTRNGRFCYIRRFLS